MHAGSAVADVSPPAFLRLAGEPLRWRLLSELARSDRRVGELTELVGQPQNAVSYHLGRMRAGGLVSMRHSSQVPQQYWRLRLHARFFPDAALAHEKQCSTEQVVERYKP